MSQEYRSLATFVQRTQRGLDTRRGLQAAIALLVVALLVVLLGIGVRQVVPSVPLLAPIYMALAFGPVLVVLVVLPRGNAPSARHCLALPSLSRL